MKKHTLPSLLLAATAVLLVGFSEPYMQPNFSEAGMLLTSSLKPVKTLQQAAYDKFNGKDKVPITNQDYAHMWLDKYGWSDQWDCENNLVMGESGWNEHATNASSGAYGLPQALPAEKMANIGDDWRSNPSTQLHWQMEYLKNNYGSPCNAWNSWQSRSPHWY